MFSLAKFRALTQPTPIGVAVALGSALIFARTGFVSAGSSETAPVTLEMQQAQVHSDLCRIRGAIEHYATDHGGILPSSLFPLLGRGEDGKLYIRSQRALTDPWHREYVYAREPVNVLTYGRDGIPGGTGADADIGYAEVVARR